MADPVTPPASPPIGVSANPEASAHLEHRLVSRWDDFLNALGSSNFYVEIGLILLAFALAWLTAAYLLRKIKNRIEKTPPKHIDIEYITKPLTLLHSVMVLPYLWVAQGLMTQIGIGGDFTSGVIELTYAYILTKCVGMAIRQKPIAYFIALTIFVNAVLRAAKVGRSVDTWLDSIGFDIGKFHFSMLHLIHGIVIFVVVFWGAGILSNTLESYLRRSTHLSSTSRHLTVKFFKVFVYVVAIAVTLSAIGIDLTAFAIFGGALGVGVGLGLQKMVSNFFSGVTLLMERSIKIGDLIEVGTYSGWVRQLNIRYALIETFDGREIIIPNEDLMSNRVVNWTLTTNMALIEVKATITFESDAVLAHKLMLEAATEQPLCLKNPPPNCWIREFANNGINLLLTFWIADVTSGRNGPQSDAMFAILKKFRENGIVLAKV